MAWLNKEKTFEEEFGMSREDFDTKMREAQEAKDKIADLEAKVSGMDDIRTQLEALRAPRVEPTRSEPKNFFEDPEGAMNERVAPVANAAINSNARVEEMIARSKYAKDFARYGSEIDGLAAKEANTFRANPVFWENLINMVRGRHASEIEESALKGERFFTEQPGGSGSGTGSNDSPESKLSPEELRSAKRLNMTPAEFLENQTYVMTQYGHGRVN